MTSRVTSPLWEYLDVEMCLKKETIKTVVSMMVTDLDANPGQVEPRIIFQLLAQQRMYTFIWKLCVCVCMCMYVYKSSGSSILSPVNSFVLLLLLLDTPNYCALREEWLLHLYLVLLIFFKVRKKLELDHVFAFYV